MPWGIAVVDCYSTGQFFPERIRRHGGRAASSAEDLPFAGALGTGDDRVSSSRAG